MRFCYTTLAKRAGFDIDVRAPWIHGIFRPADSVSERMNDRQILKAAAGALIRRHRARRAALANRAYMRGGTSLHMICTNPRVSLEACGSCTSGSASGRCAGAG